MNCLKGIFIPENDNDTHVSRTFYLFKDTKNKSFKFPRLKKIFCISFHLIVSIIVRSLILACFSLNFRTDNNWIITINHIRLHPSHQWSFSIFGIENLFFYLYLSNSKQQIENPFFLLPLKPQRKKKLLFNNNSTLFN